VSWWVSESVTALFGVFVGIGDDLDSEGRLQSEYGATPVSVWAAIQGYF
jgi:hypothetical protein